MINGNCVYRQLGKWHSINSKIYKIQTIELVGACRKNYQWKTGQDHIQMETVCNKTEGKAKSKMGRWCEEWFEEDGSEQLETKDAGGEEMERNNWASQNSQRVVELKKKKKTYYHWCVLLQVTVGYILYVVMQMNARIQIYYIPNVCAKGCQLSLKWWWWWRS